MILFPRDSSPHIFRAFSAGFPASYTPCAWPSSLLFHAPAAALPGASSYRCPPQCPPRSRDPPHRPSALLFAPASVETLCSADQDSSSAWWLFGPLTARLGP